MVLAAALFLQPAAAFAVRQISRSTEYPAPTGRYYGLTVGDVFTTGVTGVAESTVTVFGNAYARNFGTTEVIAQEGLTIGTDAWRTRSLDWFGENHFMGINVPTGQVPDAELHVNGDVDAYEFRASNGPFDGDRLLYFGVSDETMANDGEYGNWVQMGSRHGTGDWSHGESIMRVRGNPTVMLNAFSHANVGIGTKTPTFKLQLGNAGDGLVAIGFAGGWKTFSSRAYKTDITPLAPREYGEMAAKAGTLNVVRYRYKADDPAGKKLLGVLAEEAPPEILANDKKSLGLGETAAFLFAAIKGLAADNESLEREVTRLEGEVAALEAGKGRR